MLQALLSSADLAPDDLTIVEYPDFGQLAGVQQGAVDAATGFANNEPVRLEAAGGDPVVLTVDDIVPLPGNGLIVGDPTLASKRDALAAFVAATLRAMEEIIADPQVGLDAAIATVPELGTDPQTPLEMQSAVLDATVAIWQSDLTAADGLGAIDPADWTASIDYLSTLEGDLVPNPVTADELVTTELLPD
jgi:NitT/TauT family transport system substrate-binding protein